MGGGAKIRFRDGYLVYWEPISNQNWSEGYVWKETENLETLPNQEEGDLLNELNFLESYMMGSDLSKWIYRYPQNSSEEKISIKYKLADKKNHKTYFGTPPDYIIAMVDAGKKAKLLEESRQQDIKYSEEIRSLISQYRESLSDWQKEIYQTYNLQDKYRSIVRDFFKNNPECEKFALQTSSDSLDNSRVREWYEYQLKNEKPTRQDEQILAKIIFAAYNEAEQFHANVKEENPKLQQMIEQNFRPQIIQGDISRESHSSRLTFLNTVNPEARLVIHIDEDHQNKWREYLKDCYISWAKDSLPIGNSERDLYLIKNYITEYEGNGRFKIKEKDASKLSLNDVRSKIISYISSSPQIMDFDNYKMQFSYKPGVGDAYHPITDVFTIRDIISILEKNKNFRKLRESFPTY